MKKLLLLICMVGFHISSIPAVEQYKKKRVRRYNVPLNDIPQHAPDMPNQPTIEIEEPPTGIFFTIGRIKKENALPSELVDDEATDYAPHLPQKQSNDVQEEPHSDCSVGKVLITAACIVLIEYILNYWGPEQHS